MPEWIMNFPENISVDIKSPIDNAIDYMLHNWDPFFEGIYKGL
jgi:hypothetical protein